MGKTDRNPDDWDLSIEDEPEPSNRVIGAVASAANVDPFECPPLYETVNPSALNDLFDERAVHGRVTFDYAGYEVTLASNGDVTLADPDEPPETD
ncbi:HalOD1 output domain-containing protein [Halopiger djelfimassiliensis]|uniref:HalOD1 output domain-containing protein n=1 Tax=Halopiger djelfimassiliensis TaxID=1293047 RepID=UPI000677D762|nr:HalOD1 output domain-containing protein [Halopiger djelfimassiliensis]